MAKVLELPDQYKPQGTQAKGMGYRTGHTSGRMNSTEAKFADMLELRKKAGEIVEWKFEALKFRVAHPTVIRQERVATSPVWWAPDFMVMHTDGTLEFVDVKGSQHDAPAQRVKLMIVVDLFPMFRWLVARYSGSKDGWKYEQIVPDPRVPSKSRPTPDMQRI